MKSKQAYYALDQNGKQLFVGDTVLRRANPEEQFAGSPPDQKFYVIVDIQPDYEITGGHRYERKNISAGQCSYISVNDHHGNWSSHNFVFSCRCGE